jgi:hypothetical protein
MTKMPIVVKTNARAVRTVSIGENFAQLSTFDEANRRTGASVIYRTNDAYRTDDVDYEPEEPPKRRRGFRLIVVVALAIVGIVSALIWRAYGGSGPAFPSFTSASAPSAATGDKAVGIKDFQAFQQQLASQMQASTQLLGSQQAEIKRLSEQVAALAAKLDEFQHAVTFPQPAPTASVPKPAAPPVRKKPAAPKPVGASPAETPPPPPLQLSR